MTIEHKESAEQGMYKLTLTLNNGKREIHRHYAPDIYQLRRMLDRCEIKSFSIALDN